MNPGFPIYSYLFVVQSLADWQDLYGTSTPAPASVNFATQMILVYVSINCPCSGAVFENICIGTSQITVTLGEWTDCDIACPPPPLSGYRTLAAVVPQSSLPVIWYSVPTTPP
jgi:hypothetical protein